MLFAKLLAPLVTLGVIGFFVLGSVLSKKMPADAYRRKMAATIRCKSCKGQMDQQQEFLYLLPIRFDTEHEESAAYYKNRGTLIQHAGQIPSGQRAFHLHVFLCQNCRQRFVRIIDFLRVRDNESIFSSSIYPYSDFEEFLAQAERSGTGSAS